MSEYDGHRFPIGRQRFRTGAGTWQLSFRAHCEARELGERIIALAGRVASAQCRWLLLVAQFDAADGADAYGLPTTTRWLSHHCGISARTARDHLRVARALAVYPTLAKSMGAGRISYSHARIIAGIVDGGNEPELVDDLLIQAENGTVHQLEDLALGLRSIDQDYLDPIRPVEPAGERVSRSWGRDARRRFTACLDPERAALLDAALDAVQASAPDGEQLSAADALVRMAEITLATLADSPAPRRLPRGHEQVALVLHLHAVHQVSPEVVSEDEADTASVEAGAVQTVTQDAPASGRGSREPLRSCLARPAIQDEPEPADPSKAYTDVADPIAGIAPGPQPAASDGTAPAGGSREPSRSPSARPVARLADGPGIPGAVLERLTCAGRVRVVVHDPVHPRNVLDLGRSVRVVSDKQYAALLIRDEGHCRHPGCTSTYYLEAHHVVHWLVGGRTDMDNLILLCGHHHAAHHRGEFSVTGLGHGRFRFTRDGVLMPEHTDPSTLFDTDTPVEAEHDPVADDAAGNRWDGYRTSRSYATSCLAVPRYRARDARRARNAG